MSDTTSTEETSLSRSKRASRGSSIRGRPLRIFPSVDTPIAESQSLQTAIDATTTSSSAGIGNCFRRGKRLARFTAWRTRMAAAETANIPSAKRLTPPLTISLPNPTSVWMKVPPRASSTWKAYFN